jgi:hypothetical protein
MWLEDNDGIVISNLLRRGDRLIFLQEFNLDMREEGIAFM